MAHTRDDRSTPLNVALLAGGTGGERDVSLASGAACAAALRDEGCRVTEFDTAQQGFVEGLIDLQPDVVFIALHGVDGEDGKMQGLCEILGLPYTGSGVAASALAMDKAKAKAIYAANGLKTAPWVSVRRNGPFDAHEALASVGQKAVVKPVCEGSTIGVSIVEGADELDKAVNDIITTYNEVLVEKFISGTEVTIAVLGDTQPEALPIIEIVPSHHGFYDYEEKYGEGGAKHIIPARLDEDVAEECRRSALAAHEALGCYGVSRTDIIVDAEDTCWVLETNTIPGMTATSLLPDTAAKAGLSFGDVCMKLVEYALKRA